jgi:glyoxylase-like metal-dependent hydrolase (beta-lactamase superfamily II)
MRFFSIEGNRFWLDGGSMFGSYPRPIWEKWCKPDEKNRIELASRALLVQEPNGRLVLLESGIGAFFEPKLKARYNIQEEENVLLRSLAAVQIEPEDIDFIILSHLDFDHCGGLLSAYKRGERARLVFPKARFMVSRANWERFVNPHVRDEASFIPGLGDLLLASGRLEIIQSSRSFSLGAAYSFTFSDGHTPGMMITRIESSTDGPITFAGDLVPGIPWLHLPVTMGYDRFPELLIDEKKRLLERIVDTDERLFFTHDPQFAASRVAYDDQGRFIAKEARERL